MLEISLPRFKELSEYEQKGVSNNGSGKEYAGYIKVTYDGEVICLVSDAMEPEDARFYRDLSWIPGMLRKCYELGKADGDNQENTSGL